MKTLILLCLVAQLKTTKYVHVCKNKHGQPDRRVCKEVMRVASEKDFYYSNVVN